MKNDNFFEIANKLDYDVKKTALINSAFQFFADAFFSCKHHEYHGIIDEGKTSENIIITIYNICFQFSLFA